MKTKENVNRSGEALRILFFVFYVAILAGMIMFVRPFAKVRHEQARLNKTKIEVRSVLPVFDNTPWEELFVLEGDKIYPALKVEGDKKKLLAVAFSIEVPAENESHHAFLGVSPGGYITGLVFTDEEMKRDREWKDFFQNLEGRSLGGLSLLEDGGTLAATHDLALSRAVLEAARKGIAFFFRNRETILERFEPLAEPVVEKPVVVETPQPPAEPSAKINPPEVDYYLATFVRPETPSFEEVETPEELPAHEA